MGGPDLDMEITAFDVDDIYNVLIGGRKLDTSVTVADSDYKAFAFLLEGDTC